MTTRREIYTAHICSLGFPYTRDGVTFTEVRVNGCKQEERDLLCMSEPLISSNIKGLK